MKGSRWLHGRGTPSAYVVLVLVSVLPAGLLFGLLHSTGAVRLATSDQTLTAEFGGAFAGFLIVLLLLLRAYNRNSGPQRIGLRGNVYEPDDNPAPGAMVFVEGNDTQAYAEANGWFELTVDAAERYTVRATLDGRTAACEITNDQAAEPIRLTLSRPNPYSQRLQNEAPPPPTQPLFELRGPCPEALVDLLEELARGRVVLVVGSGLLDLLGAQDPRESDALRTAMEDVQRKAEGGQIAEAQEQLGRFLQLPRWRFMSGEDASREQLGLYRQLASFDWERIYTTSYDLLLEAAGQNLESAADDDEYLASRAANTSGSALVVKLCGDVRHTAMIRASLATLRAGTFKRDAYALYTDLIYHLTNRPFLFVGYEPNDPFLEYVVSFMDLEPPVKDRRRGRHYVLTQGLSTVQRRDLRMQYGGALVPVNLELDGSSSSGPSKAAALSQFLEGAWRYCQTPPRSRPHVLPEACQRIRQSGSSSGAWRLPIVTTGDSSARASIEGVINPAIEGTQWEKVFFDSHDVGLGHVRRAEFETVLRQALCVVFLFDRPSVTLDAIVEDVRTMRLLPIVLCGNEAHLGDFSSTLPSRRLDSSEVVDYIQGQLLAAVSEGRLARSERLLETGEFDSCIMHAWVAVEEYLRYAAGASSSESVWKVIGRLWREGSLERVNRDNLAVMRKLRNDIEHKGVVPTGAQAERTVELAKELVRSVKFNIRPKLRTLPTYERGEESEKGILEEESA